MVFHPVFDLQSPGLPASRWRSHAQSGDQVPPLSCRPAETNHYVCANGKEEDQNGGHYAGVIAKRPYYKAHEYTRFGDHSHCRLDSEANTWHRRTPRSTDSYRNFQNRHDQTSALPSDGTTNPARSSVSRRREAENREKPNSARSCNASSNSADRFQPAKSQQTAPTWRIFPGSREAGSHQLQEIGPYNGRRFGPATGFG